MPESSVTASGKPGPTNPVVAGLSKQKSPHPYSAVSFSPCRQYAATACKDTLQILKVGANGLRLIKTVVTAPYFQHDNSTSTQSKINRTQDGGHLNLRDFALGGGGAPQQQQQQGAANSMINVVITDVAWSSGKVQRNKKKKHESDEDEDDDGWQKIDAMANDAERIQQRLHSSMIAAAGSNGVIVIWSAAALLEVDKNTPNNHPSASAQAPEAVLSQHLRTVNRLAWHPTKPGLLLSASQDGTVLLWERRKKDAALVTHDKPDTRRFKGLFGLASLTAPVQQQRSLYRWYCRSTFAPKSEAVRDIRWSPFYEDGTWELPT